MTTLLLLAAMHAMDSLRAASRAGRLRRFFLLAMAGNFTLILAQDMLSFYLGLTMMGLSAAGLVAHRGCAAARQAGRLYLIIWTLLGEMLLFSALILLLARSASLDFAALQTSTPAPLAVALLIGCLAGSVSVASFGQHAQQFIPTIWQRGKDMPEWVPGRSSGLAAVTLAWNLAGALWLLLAGLILLAILRSY